MGKNMEDRLKYILTLVNEWLAFAEKKNALLIAADSAVILGLIRILKNDLSTCLYIYVYSAIGCLLVSALSCLISFIPKLKKPLLFPLKKPQSSDNLFFYGDIAKYTPADYINALYKASELETSKILSIEKALSEQIIINSRIALTKYKYFRLALWMTISAVITPILSLFFYYFLERTKEDLL